MPRGILVRTAIAAFLVVGVITGILLVRTSNRFYAHTGAMNVPVDPGRPIYLSVRISYEGPVGVDVDSIEAIEENHERYVARFLSPGEGVSVTPFPNMTSITWPVKFKRQRMVNVVFVMDDLPANVRITVVRVTYRIMGMRFEWSGNVDYRFIRDS